MSRYYEIPLLFAPDAPVHALMSIANKVLSILDCDGTSKVLKCEYWGLRDLAYPIKRNVSARYYVLIIEGNPSLIDECVKYLNIIEIVLRHAVYVCDKPDLNDSAIITKKPNEFREEDKEYSKIFA